MNCSNFFDKIIANYTTTLLLKFYYYAEQNLHAVVSLDHPYEAF